MTEWARCDARGAHRHVRETFGSDPLAIVGHSFGGQLVGLIEEAREAAGAIFVGAQLGYYGYWPLLQRAGMAVLWHGLVPAFNATLGYVPGQAGIGEDLPAGVAAEWSRWCTSPGYLLSAHPDAAFRFGRFDRPLAFYSFTDDAFAPSDAVHAMLDHLPPARVDHRRVAPRDLGKGPIGHFGFFRPRFEDPFWSDSLAFLDDVFAGRTPRRKGQPVPARKKALGWGMTEAELLSDLRHLG
jgi:predicted alpha/beta hydrolase